MNPTKKSSKAHPSPSPIYFSSSIAPSYSNLHMGSIKLYKYQAMMKSHKHKHNIQNSSLVALILGLPLSTPLWLPTLCSSTKLFFIESLPKVVDTALGPRCLFLVFNLIIIFLVGESRLSGSSSTEHDTCEEYIVHAHKLKALASPLVEANEIAREEELIGEELELEEREMATEELNKRVEDFIERVNMQRRLEARLLVCCCG